MSAILPLNLRHGKLIDSERSCVYPTANVGKNSSMLRLSEKDETHRKGKVYEPGIPQCLAKISQFVWVAEAIQLC